MQYAINAEFFVNIFSTHRLGNGTEKLHLKFIALGRYYDFN